MSAAPHSTDQEILVARDRDEHAALAAELLGRAIVEAVNDRGVARVALSGGTTPAEAYRKLAALALPFDRVEWYWVDERGVPPDHARSNYAAAARDLSLADGRHGRAFRMEGEHDLDKAAALYEALLRRSFGVASAVAFDAMTLGVGDDGHTASLFPGTGAVAVNDRLVAHVREQPEKKLEARVTLTAPVILEARLAVVLARGESKRAPIAAARAPGDEEETPARILQRAKGRVVWVLDEAAAGG
ncbi:MAG: 6-phosphogluconolactonase [Minicystis sp.]